MGYRNLQEFIVRLEQAGELVRIKEPVSPHLEITEITDRVCKVGGPALLFEEVTGYELPVLMNAFGSLKRMGLALEVDSLDAIAAEILSFLEAEANTLMKKLMLLPKLARLGRMFPKVVSRAPCQEVVYTGEQVDLSRLPVLTCWPQDGGPFITLPVVITHHPETGRRNVGMYRLQVYDGRTTGMHWHAHKGGAQHYRVAESRGESLPVAVAIGPDPAVTYAATAPLPEDLDEILFAGFLRGEPVELVPCLTQP
ncbi:MAG: UbiD family decarboxylase, partial [Acidovorax sp.]|nr:UbiD family decarboxylase [Acidovorax sp.]